MYIYIHIYVGVYVNTYTYIYIYMYTYRHIHVWRRAARWRRWVPVLVPWLEYIFEFKYATGLIQTKIDKLILHICIYRFIYIGCDGTRWDVCYSCTRLFLQYDAICWWGQWHEYASVMCTLCNGTCRVYNVWYTIDIVWYTCVWHI